MSSSFVEYRGRGFWSWDGYLEHVLALLADRIGSSPKQEWLVQLRDHWSTQSSGAFSGWIHPKLDEFAEIQRQIIKAKNLPYNDLRKAFVEHWQANNPENKGSGILTYDGNHFNDAGMRFVAEQMMRRFK